MADKQEKEIGLLLGGGLVLAVVGLAASLTALATSPESPDFLLLIDYDALPEGDRAGWKSFSDRTGAVGTLYSLFGLAAILADRAGYRIVKQS